MYSELWNDAAEYRQAYHRIMFRRAVGAYSTAVSRQDWREAERQAEYACIERAALDRAGKEAS